MANHRVAIIGCSPGRGRDHARAFVRNAGCFDLVAVCDRNAERLAAVAGEFGVSHTYTDADAMLTAEKPDVLCFVTPPDIRLELIELGVRHRVKAIAYEKPMATNWPEAREIHELCRQAGVRTILSHQHKYGPHWQKVRQLVAAGEIGEVRTVHASSKGWMLHYATHLVDGMMFLSGQQKAEWVVGHVHGRGKLDDNHPSPDYLFGQIGFASGVRGILECGTLAPDLPGNNPFWFDAGVTVHGSDGFAQVIVGSGWRARTRSASRMQSGRATFSADHDQPLYIRDLADWLGDSDKVHPCSGELAFHGFEVIMGMCLSALDRRRIDLPLETDEDILSRMRNEIPDCPPRC